MEIEFGFQANCSELVTHLEFSTKEEIAQAMLRIQELTGWTWRIRGSDQRRNEEGKILSVTTYHIMIPQDRLEQLFELDRETGDFGFRPADLIPVWEGRLSDPVKESMIRRGTEAPPGWRCDRPRLMDISPDEPVATFDRPVSWFSVNISCECGRSGLRIWFGHCETPLMPQFHKIRRSFNSDYQGHDGGSIRDYMEWMGYHYLDKKTVIEYLKKWRDTEEDVMSDIKCFEKYPPLPESGELTKEEKEDINRWLD